MRWVKPVVFLVSKSVPDVNKIEEWLRTIGVSEEGIKKYGDPNSSKTNAERLVELAGRRCYMSFEPKLNPNIQKIREDIAEYLTNILKSGHGSVLEHASFTFAIENVSRVLTGEMNRHRAGVAISEGSMRFIRYNDIPIVEVDSLIPNDPDPEVNKLIAEDRVDIEELMVHVQNTYLKIAERWKAVLEGKNFAKKKHLTSRMRRIVPMGVGTGGFWTFNVRALRHMVTMRASEAAEEEILMVACLMLEIMMKEEPILFGDFKLDSGYWKPTYVKV